MDLEKAIKQIGDLQAETATLRSHKERLEADLKEARDKRRTAEEQAQKLVPEGATVLTPEDAKLWSEYQALGKVSDLKTALESRDETQARLAALERQQLITEAAGTTLNAKALAKFLPETARLEPAEETKDGKTVKAFKVVEGEGKDAKATPLSEWVKGVETDLGLSLHTIQKTPPTGPGSTPDAKPTSEEDTRQAKERTGLYNTL